MGEYAAVHAVVTVADAGGVEIEGTVAAVGGVPAAAHGECA